MKRFIKKITFLTIALVSFNFFLLFAIPKDNNAYLCEYIHKIQLIDTTSQPRIIFIGGSNIAFGTDSKMICDSLHRNVVNFGLQGGIGIRYPLEDCLQYVRKGDIIILQFEYWNFFSGGNGEAETFPGFMVANDWRNYKHLNMNQWQNIIAGIPKESIKSMTRLAKYLLHGSFNSPSVNEKYAYVKSGFNEFGDEVSHIAYPSVKYTSSEKPNTKKVKRSFIDWLANIIQQYEQAGANVVMLPPVCIESHFKVSYNDNIEKSLIEIHHPYITSPASMVLDDSCTFNTGYHMNKEGIRQNTRNIISILKRLHL